ncbi:MAG: hypothetical protein ACR2MS_03525 [Weeksellaceae bacterium]
MKYDPKSPLLKVEQIMFLHRAEADSVFHFYSWANAYKDKTTQLSNIKLSQRKDAIYFADLEERGWIENLTFELINENGKEIKLPFNNEENELVQVSVPKSKYLKIKSKYLIHLPSKRFTGYGRGDDGSLLLKYFFIQPEVRQDGVLLRQNYRDFESLTAKSTNYTLNFKVPKGFEIYTDLIRTNIDQYAGKERDFFQIAIQKEGNIKTVNTAYGKVIFDRTFPPEDYILIQKIVQQQLKFLTQRLGLINEPLFISGKSYRKNKFQGVQDIDIPIIKKKYRIFNPADRIKLEMISQLTDAYLDRKALIYMQSEHWLRNGLAHYLLLEYLENELPDLIVAGNIPEDIAIGNFKPLKYLDASKVKMTERSKWMYNIVLLSNFNQPINTPYEELSNLNQEIVSGVKTGLSFQYLAAYIGKEKFNNLIKEWINQSKDNLSANGLRSFLEARVQKPTDWFFDDMISYKGWYDIGIKNAIVKQDSLVIKFRNRGNSTIPFKFNAYSDSAKYSTWLQNSSANFELKIPNQNYETLVINDSIQLPDFKSNNDLYHVNAFFNRKIKFGWVTDIPTRSYEKVFLLPGVSWNNYDKLQLGLSIGNRTPIPQTWVYRIKPQYSFGENALTGSFQLVRNVYPINHLFRKVRVGIGGSYQHYNRGLAYKNLGVGIEGIFRKSPRSTMNRSAFAYHQLIDRDLRTTATEKEKELKSYGLLNVGFRYWNTNIIHERRMLMNLQLSNTFGKLYGEYYYRWKFGKDKIIGVRLFAGAFLSHDLNHSEYFDFGLDRVNDYTYSYPLLGRSESQGFLSQQFVLAEGGFKSNFNKKSNQLLFTTNWEYPIWNILDAYADFGYIKNKDNKGEFLYDSGFRIRFIPDYLELYFPIQSTLGFEPTLGAYHERIRFMLNLDLKKFMDYWRRGKN